MNTTRETDLQKKIRIRSEEELQMQAKGLIESKKIFDALGIPYFLGAGTLLGAYRNSDFIPWDWDVQCYFRYEDVADKTEQLIKAFKSEGFQLIDRVDEKKKWKQVYKKYNTDYEYTSWFLNGKWRYRAGFQLPEHFFQDGYEIEFYGENFPCVGPIEEYLEFNYGDWRTPKREAVKERYLNKKFYKYPYFFRRLSTYVQYALHPRKAFLKIQEILAKK